MFKVGPRFKIKKIRNSKKVSFRLRKKDYFSEMTVFRIRIFRKLIVFSTVKIQ